jgi:hypothetical protein
MTANSSVKAPYLAHIPQQRRGASWENSSHRFLGRHHSACPAALQTALRRAPQVARMLAVLGQS